MEKSSVVFLLLVLSCASHHPRGTVLAREGETSGLMSVDSHSLKEGDDLIIMGQVCRFFPRGNLNCRNETVGPAKVESFTGPDRAIFRTPAGVDFRKGDYLLPSESHK